MTGKYRKKPAKRALFSHRKFYHIFAENTRVFPQKIPIIVDKK
jgi:hypothetical protein